MTGKGRTLQLNPVCLLSKPFKVRPTKIPILALPSLYPCEPVLSLPSKGSSTIWPGFTLPLGLGCWKHLPWAGSPVPPARSVFSPCAHACPWAASLSPCRERERREKEREEWERQYSRQSRSPSPRYSEYPHGLWARSSRSRSQAARSHGAVSIALHTCSGIAIVTGNSRR